MGDTHLKQTDIIRIAILDMYEGTPNEGMRGIRQLIEEFEVDFHQPIRYEIFDVRTKAEVPGTDFDAYISSGGPGSPIDSAGSLWEQRYFGLMDAIKAHNQANPAREKPAAILQSALS